MPELYHVDYRDADGLHEAVKYDLWCDVVKDVRQRVTTGWNACVYRYFKQYELYLYLADANPWNEREERRQREQLGDRK